MFILLSLLSLLLLLLLLLYVNSTLTLRAKPVEGVFTLQHTPANHASKCAQVNVCLRGCSGERTARWCATSTDVQHIGHTPPQTQRSRGPRNTHYNLARAFLPTAHIRFVHKESQRESNREPLNWKETK